MVLVTMADRGGKRAPALEDNMYAQLLKLAVSGSLSPEQSYRLSGAVLDFMPDRLHGFKTGQQGGDAPRVGHRIVRRRWLESIYESLRVTWKEKVSGDFVAVGFSGGGASIFAAVVIKQLSFDRKVWLCYR
jgi:hypothetical protein